MNGKAFLIVLFTLILGFALRIHNYTLYPQRGATSDEYAFAFAGVSLIKLGVPIAWSAIPLYTNRYDLTIQNLYFPMVTPYLDHPPLFGLILGAWAIARGETTFDQITLSTIRIVPVVLWTISGIFLFGIGNRLFGLPIALLSLAIYATAPIFVINSRLAVAESLMTPLFLASIYLISKTGIQSKKDIVLLGMVSGLSFFSKVLGIVAWFSVFYFLLSQMRKNMTNILLFLTLSALTVGLFIFYGTSFGGSLFWRVQTYQGGRMLGPDTFWTIITTPIIVNKVFYDGWYFFGHLSLFLLFQRTKSYLFVTVPALIYLLLMLFSVKSGDIHGWYMIPMYPFMALSSGVILWEITQKRSLFIIIAVLIIGMYLIGALYQNHFGLTSNVFRLLLGSLLAPLLITYKVANLQLYKRVSVSYIILLIFGNIAATVLYIHPA